MRVKFRLGTDVSGKHITQVFLVSDSGTLDLVTQISGWVGIDVDSIGKEAIDKVAATVTEKADDTKDRKSVV